MKLRYFFVVILITTIGGCSAPETTVPADTGRSADLGKRSDGDMSPPDVGLEVRDAIARADVLDAYRADAADLTDISTELTNDALLAALRRDADATMVELGYNDARDALYAFGGIADRDGRIECIYTGRTVDTDGTRTPSENCTLADGTPTNCQFNTEHVVPRGTLRDELLEGSPEYDAAEGDLHHLFPSEEFANTKRGSFEFGETACEDSSTCAYSEESHLGIPEGETGDPDCPIMADPGEATCVMEVRPERRGDVARATFYMAMKWELRIDGEADSTLRTWHDTDPPDDWEQTRNDAVEDAQGNRNPFIDAPGLVMRIDRF